MRRAPTAAAFTLLVTGGLLAGLLPTATAASHPPSAMGSGAAAATSFTRSVPGSAGLDAKYHERARLAREKVRRGDRDDGVRHIEHVRELQYRLTWAGAYHGPVTGYFGHLTRRAVERFQRRADLRVSGVAEQHTWHKLLKRTVRHEKAMPSRCRRGAGWHACYDRSRHQITLWRGGKLWNTWLARGGDRAHKTRTGRFSVFYRDKDHVSSIYHTAMPYSQFFSGGQAFHGSPSMTDPFSGHSHGCVNMYIEDARQLWKLTHDKHLDVHVYGAWS